MVFLVASRPNHPESGPINPSKELKRVPANKAAENPDPISLVRKRGSRATTG